MEETEEEIGEETEGGTGEAEKPEDPKEIKELGVPDVKKEISEQDYETLTLGEDEIAERCLEKARIAIKGMILSTGNEYDEFNEVCRMAVLKRTLYELFAFAGQEQRAREKQEDLELLIETYYGPVIRKSDENGASRAHGAIMNKRTNPLSRSSRLWE